MFNLILIALVGYALAKTQMTVTGCECKSSCGASIAVGLSKLDWCWTKDKCGPYIGTLFRRYDYCDYSPDPEYEAQTAFDKWDSMVEFLGADNHISKDFPSQGGILGEAVTTTFTNFADVMPANRIKYIHSIGSTAGVKFESVKGHKYTGLFQGASFGLIRLSTAKPISDSNITPGFGLKFFRNSMPSANLVAMPSLSGQSEFDFFKHTFSNHIPKPEADLALQAIVLKFKQASMCPRMVGVSDFSTHTSEGVKILDPMSPFRLDFKVDSESVDPFPDHTYTSADMQTMFEDRLPAGTKLFNVYAHASSQDWVAGVEPELIGHLTTTTAFYPEVNQDEKLFFRHQNVEEDFAANPQWIEGLDAMAHCDSAEISTTRPF